MSICTGILGRPCTCGLIHTSDHGRTVDTHTDEAPRARTVYLAPGVIDRGEQDSPITTPEDAGLLASRCFWIGGALSVLVWIGFLYLLSFLGWL